jgi:death-on-curing protein
MFHFLGKELVVAIHDDQVLSFGGILGFLNKSLLDSALGQPKITLHFFQDATIYDLAAIYGYHICKNHAFRDGNKRTACAAMMVFLEYNGLRITASKDEIEGKILAIESGAMDKDQLAEWLSSATAPI